jgi:plastocyanin
MALVMKLMDLFGHYSLKNFETLGLRSGQTVSGASKIDSSDSWFILMEMLDPFSEDSTEEGRICEMKSTVVKRLRQTRQNAFLSPYQVTSIVILFILAAASYGHGSQNMGSVTGKATVFEKKFFGGLKKKKDMSQTVVYITGFKTKTPDEIMEIRQKNKRFIPYILPVVAGQRVNFPNQDKIYHNVFSISPLATFDLGQYKGADPARTVIFEKYGVVPIYCNIHPKMIAYAVVLENTAFALTDRQGAFRIDNLPAGTYTINAWRPKAKRVNQTIVIQAGQSAEVHMELKEVLKIGTHRRKDGTQYPDESGPTGYDK